MGDLSQQATQLLALLRELAEPMRGPRQPFRVAHRRDGVVRISHFSMTPDWHDDDEAAFQELLAAGLLLPAPGEPGNDSYFPVPAGKPERQKVGRRVDAEDIFEFARLRGTRRVAAAARERLREADEESELEPALRRILDAVDETPHGPTEIADILTPVTVDGHRLEAAFVNKGKASRKVKVRDVSHQLYRVPLEHPGVDLVVLSAVGDIQDKAKAALADMANKNGILWAILNRALLARLFVAYGEMCPNDGAWLFNGECRECPYAFAWEEGGATD